MKDLIGLVSEEDVKAMKKIKALDQMECLQRCGKF